MFSVFFFFIYLFFFFFGGGGGHDYLFFVGVCEDFVDIFSFLFFFFGGGGGSSQNNTILEGHFEYLEGVLSFKYFWVCLRFLVFWGGGGKQ